MTVVLDHEWLPASVVMQRACLTRVWLLLRVWVWVRVIGSLPDWIGVLDCAQEIVPRSQPNVHQGVWGDHQPVCTVRRLCKQLLNQGDPLAHRFQPYVRGVRLARPARDSAFISDPHSQQTPSGFPHEHAGSR